MEKLGDYLPVHRHGMLGRIFLAKQLTDAVQALVPGELKVVIRAKTITLNCAEPAYAKRLTLERRKLEAILTRLAGQGHNLTLKIRTHGPGTTDR
ncbi:MAG TPA: hypothetical protein VLE93_00335 [Candidatus Saccharimonadales bacterium]|nr:hypothetical protein [Candidatus Saccharimonadales bacterium]